MATFSDWLAMCAGNDEFVENYNRLRGTHISFKPPRRSPIELAIDCATGHVPLPENDPDELRQFLGFCMACLARVPADHTT